MKLVSEPDGQAIVITCHLAVTCDHIMQLVHTDIANWWHLFFYPPTCFIFKIAEQSLMKIGILCEYQERFLSSVPEVGKIKMKFSLYLI